MLECWSAGVLPHPSPTPLPPLSYPLLYSRSRPHPTHLLHPLAPLPQVLFAIIGMQLFRGRLGGCTDPTQLTIDACLAQPNAAWLNPSSGSFDNFGEAMRLLYVMSTGANPNPNHPKGHPMGSKPGFFFLLPHPHDVRRAFTPLCGPFTPLCGPRDRR